MKCNRTLKYKLSNAYKNLFDELSGQQYESRTVYEHYVEKKCRRNTNKTVVILRIDVDYGFHLSYILASELAKRGLKASHYFILNPEKYYKVSAEIIRGILSLNHEVGLHSDHLTQQLSKNKNGLDLIRNDVQILSELLGEPIKGMVHHGDSVMDKLGKCNLDIYDNVKPEELGLEYHDGKSSCYADLEKGFGIPKCDLRIIDFLGIPSSWGWNYIPWYPLNFLRKNTRPGNIICIDIHTHNPFFYWKDWIFKYNEVKKEKESLLTFIKKLLRIMLVLYLFPIIVEVLSFLRLKLFTKKILKFFKKNPHEKK